MTQLLLWNISNSPRMIVLLLLLRMWIALLYCESVNSLNTGVRTDWIRLSEFVASKNTSCLGLWHYVPFKTMFYETTQTVWGVLQHLLFWLFKFLLHANSTSSKNNTRFFILFFVSIEPVFQNFSCILYVILLYHIVGEGRFLCNFMYFWRLFFHDT